MHFDDWRDVVQLQMEFARLRIYMIWGPGIQASHGAHRLGKG
jgi:hypothetical protein